MSAPASLLFSHELQKIFAETAQLELAIERGLEVYTKEFESHTALEDMLERFQEHYFSRIGPLVEALEAREAAMAACHLHQPVATKALEKASFAGAAVENLTSSNDGADSSLSPSPLPEFRFTERRGRQTLRSLYRALAKESHPDTRPSMQASPAEDESFFLTVRQAYEKSDLAGMLRLDFELFRARRGLSSLRRWQGMKKRQLALKRARQELSLENDRLRRSSLYLLKERVDSARLEGFDLIAEIEAELEEKLSAYGNAKRLSLHTEKEPLIA